MTGLFGFCAVLMLLVCIGEKEPRSKAIYALLSVILFVLTFIGTRI